MKNTIITQVEECIQTVFDPDFPLIDIWTMGLIYDIRYIKRSNQLSITMTYTTPACPSGEIMQDMMRNAILEKFPAMLINIDLTFDPMRTIQMIKDEDLQRMFE